MGIDPGSEGFISTCFEGAWEHFSIKDNSLLGLARILRQIKEKHPQIACVMEDVHALGNSSAASTFSFGKINGILLGLLVAFEIPYTLIQPKEWQEEIWINADKVIISKKVKRKDKEIVKKEVETKKTSINACRRLFPSIDMRRTPKCEKPDDNKVDSVLLCEYGRRKNL